MESSYNIIWVVGDALQTRNLGCYGYEKDTSPFIDSLTGRGVLFGDCFACSNHTDSSITSMMTGRFPVSHGIMHHGRRVGSDELRKLKSSGSVFLAERLRDNGFSTIGFDWLGR